MGAPVILASIIAVVAVSDQTVRISDQGATRVSSRGETLVRATLGGVTVSASLLTHQVQIGSPHDLPPKRPTTNCTYSHTPCSLLDSLEIRVGRDEVAIPRSAFGTLSDIWHARLDGIGKNRFVPTMNGGDASEGYTVKIVFDRHRVIQRTVIDGEAQQVSERTLYSDLSRAFEN